MSPVRGLLLLLFLFLFLSSACRSRAAPLTCEQLLQPLDRPDPHRLEGTWALVAGSISYPPAMENFRLRDSASTSFSTNQTDVTMTRTMSLNDQCHYVSMNISLEGSSFSFTGEDINATFTRAPCHDCILMSLDAGSGRRLIFYLYSRRRQLEEQELEEFRRQAECLKLPPPHVTDPTKELCPLSGATNATVATTARPGKHSH